MPLRSFSQAEVLLTERRRMERPLLMLILLGVLAFSVAENRFVYTLLAVLAVSVNLLASQQAKEVFVHRIFINAGVLVATAMLVAELVFVRSELLVKLGHYLILIQLCKLFDRKSNRDYVQMLLLSMLLIVAAAMTSQSLMLAFLMAAYLALASYTMMVFTVKRGLDAAATARLPSEKETLAPHRVAWNVTRDWPASPLRRRLLATYAGVLVTGVLVFLIAPRSPAASGKDMAVTGPGNVRLGEPRKVYLSDRVVMQVNVENAGASADNPSLYLRGQVFNRYADSSWTRHVVMEMPIPEQSPPLPPELLGSALVQHVRMSPSLLPTLYAAYPAVSVESQASQAVRATSDLEFTLMSTPAEGQVSYTAYSLPQPMTPRHQDYLASLRRSSVVETRVERSQRVQDLAQQWCADLLAQRRDQPSRRDELDMAIANRLAQQLRQRCRYTLDLSDADPSRDGLDDFLFYMKRGHCEYFASALTAMCVCLDVQARLATGFRSDADGRAGGEYFLRERDAHAWTEVYTPSTDWTIIDATPGASTEADKSAWAKLADFWSKMQIGWARNVVSYNNGSRRKIADALLQGWSDFKSRLAAGWESLQQSVLNLLLYGQIDSIMARFAYGLAAIGVLLEALLLIRLHRRRRADRAAEAASPHLPRRHLKRLNQLLKLLHRRGARHQPSQTLLEYARAAAAALRLPPDLLLGPMGLYYRTRWGKIAPQQRELELSEQQIQQARRVLARRT